MELSKTLNLKSKSESPPQEELGRRNVLLVSAAGKQQRPVTCPGLSVGEQREARRMSGTAPGRVCVCVCHAD